MTPKPPKIFRAAQSRLLEIWNYTEQTWGEKQADTYIRALVAAIDQAQTQRHRWRSLRDRTLPGIYFIRHKHHYIFFRELSDATLGVISILHENMDIPARLRDDDTSSEI